MSKCRCSECNCGWHGDENDALKADHPFINNREILFCPECLEPNTIVIACDEDGCWRKATCGTPTGDGYLRLCSEHYSKHGLNELSRLSQEIGMEM